MVRKYEVIGGGQTSDKMKERHFLNRVITNMEIHTYLKPLDMKRRIVKIIKSALDIIFQEDYKEKE